MDIIKAHIVAIPSVAAAIVGASYYLDKGILFALRFVPEAKLDAILDAINARLKARVALDAAKQTPPSSSL